MSLYVISDLHLSSAVNKPMDVFGYRWTGYTDKIVKYWKAVVSDDDTVIIPGDISWGISLEESLSDFRLIASLPGKKILGKGNHDYWWSTVTKMTAFFEEHDISGMEFLFNNAIETDDFIITGTRGWYTEDKQSAAPDTADYKKIVAREAARLKLGLKSAEALKREGDTRETLVFFHFPPVFRGFVCREFIDILKEFGVKRAYFGHIHGVYNLERSFNYEGIDFIITSADFLSFVPLAIMPDIDY